MAETTAAVLAVFAFATAAAAQLAEARAGREARTRSRVDALREEEARSPRLSVGPTPLVGE
jgi:hypothetical protein